MYYLGIDIGGTAVKCGLFTKAGRLLRRHEFPTKEKAGSEVKLSYIAKGLSEAFLLWEIKGSDIIAAGIGIPGQVTKDALIKHCPNIGWRDYDIAREFYELMGIKAMPLNDAKAAALGEYWQGGGKKYESIFMITLGTGVGGALITREGIFWGNDGYSGEIGHMTVNPLEAELCGCGGRGHLEQYASATGLVKSAIRELNKAKEPSLLRSIENPTAKDIFELSAKQDALAKRLTDSFARTLGLAVANIAQTVNPEAFIIGGGVSRAGWPLVDAIGRYADSFVMPTMRSVRVVLAELGNDAGIFGAAKFAQKDNAGY